MVPNRLPNRCLSVLPNVTCATLRPAEQLGIDWISLFNNIFCFPPPVPSTLSGIAISALFVHNVNAASIFAAIAQIPMLLFTGLLVQINTLPSFIRPLTYLSYYRLCFESALIILYGYGRCERPKPFNMQEVRRLLGDDVEEVMDCVGQHVNIFGGDSDSSLFSRFDRLMTHVDNQNPSLIMKNFNLSDSDLHFEIGLLALYAIMARLIAYVVLYRKATAQK